MCTVEKLLIKGVRSFSPDNQNVIEFYRPLTLIVGSNGAGKTTIIECLKQACTGELPPNTKSGQSFIHDPKVAGETEVKAQIKLRIRNAAGAPVVVCRSFQAALQFKTLDSVLQTYNKDTGAKQAITYRCADMDRMVPGLMGVSKAILENVIFVHQEDSNWPLAEGKVLKAKFDDIFAATKYTKALEAFRKLRTEKMAELKEAKLKLENLKTHKDAAHKLRSQVAAGKDAVAKAEAEISELQSQLDAIEDEMAAADATLDKINALNDAQSKVDAQLAVVQRQAAEQAARLENDFEEPTSELETYLENYDTRAREMQGEVQDLSRQAGSKRLEAEALKDQYSKACKRHGRLAAEAEAHATNVRARDRLVRDTAARFGIPLRGCASSSLPTISSASTGSGAVSAGGAAAAQPPPLPPAAVEAFCAELGGRVAELQQRLSEARAAGRREDEALTAEVDAANAAVTRAAEARRMKQELLVQLQQSAEALTAEITACNITDAELGTSRGTVEILEQELAAKQRDMEQARYDDQLSALRSEMEGLNRRLQELRTERDRASALGDASSTLRLKRQELAGKRAELEGLLTAKRTPLLQLLGADQLPLPSQIKAAAEAAVAKQRQALDGVKGQLQQAQAKKRSLQSELSTKTSELGRTQVAVESLSEELRVGLVGATLLPEGSRRVEAFDAALAELEQIKDDAVFSAQKHKAMVYAVQVNEEMAHAEHACPLCHRGFPDEALFQAFLRQMKEEGATEPEKQREADVTAQRAQAQAAALRTLRPKAAQRAQQAAALGPLRERVGQLQQAIATADTEIEHLSEEESLMAAELSRAAQLASDAGWQAAALDKAVAELEKHVESLERRSAATASAGRSVADIDADILQVEGDRQHKEVDRENLLRKQVKARDEVMAKSVQLAEQRQEYMKQQGRARRVSDLRRRLDEITRQQSEAAAAAEEAGRGGAPLGAARDAAVERRAAARAAAAQREAAVDAQIRDAQSALDQVTDKCRLVTDYAAAGGAADLARVTQEVETLGRRIEDAHKQVDEIERDLQRKQGDLGDMGETRRQIVAVLDCRRTTEKQRALEQQLAELEQQKRQYGEYKAVNADYQSKQRARADLKSRQDRVRGRLEVERAGLLTAERDLAAPVYSDIDTKTRTKTVEVSTIRYATEDLEKYHRALEKALLTFHTGKMADINRTVKELWEKTYRGQDIDYIQIKADADGARSYNYRVVMYSGGVELDMRGRCSAGQKVLASLIIRLALAENFCLNCGILALDEPTTNLDAANASALAEALRTVMAARRDQENFQLIVITHDESFASQIGTRQHADYLWRVTKDEAQHSHVAQEDITG